MTACPTCSGATDVPDGKGGIMPCPACSRPRRRIDDLDLSARALTRLKMDMIEYADEVPTKSDAELLQIPGLGRVTLAEIRAVLALEGFGG